jgi:hypothetical protein
MRPYEISRGARKLAWTPKIIKEKRKKRKKKLTNIQTWHLDDNTCRLGSK